MMRHNIGHSNIDGFFFQKFCQNCSFHTKGQLISEAIFLSFNSSKKRTKYLQNFALATRAEVFRLFFGRIETRKKIF